MKQKKNRFKLDVDISTSSPPENPRVNSLKIIKSRHVLPAPNRILNRPNHVMILYYWHGISRRLPLCDHHHHRPQIMAWLINKQYLQQPEPLIWAIILAPRLKKRGKRNQEEKWKRRIHTPIKIPANSHLFLVGRGRLATIKLTLARELFRLFFLFCLLEYYAVMYA